MDKRILKKTLADASEMGTLLTPKHDPKNLTTTYAGYRSVLIPELADNLDAFFHRGEYDARLYRNSKHPDSPYIEIQPWPESRFSVTASGVAAGSIKPYGPLDRLVAVSGTCQGWHVFGENSDRIKKKKNDGELDLIEVID